jgi:putative glutamine amidotransferase
VSAAAAAPPDIPVVGLSTYREPARWAAWHAPAVLLPASYVDDVSAAGGAPVLLPSAPGAAAAAARLDGLILTGGGDLDPASYGQRPHPRTGRVSAERDQAELALLGAALSAGLPVLGICRGMQLLNVARGGTLRQHLPDGSGHAPPPGTFGSHPVRVAPASRLAAIVEGTVLDVPTSHHQAIEALGAGLAAAAWADDGVIEAVELTNSQHPFVIAVQWHPEAGPDRRLIQALVDAARQRRASPPGEGAARVAQPLHSRA